MADPPPEAGPVELDVLVVGAGFAGLAMAIKLKERRPRARFLVLEAATRLGGTWRDNTYPGAACDVQSHLYSFSFRPSAEWSRTYPRQAEILDYMEDCAREAGLAPHLRFEARVESARWDAGRARWIVSAAGQTYHARALVSATGALSQAALPAIPGLETFAGERWHSSAWRHGVSLAGKRVGVIGTGASTIQFVPQIAPECAELFVCQRTPPWILPKHDVPFSDLERLAFRHVPGARALYRAGIYWRLEGRVLPFSIYPTMMGYVQRQARRYLEASVPDPALRAALTPDYTIGCKRILISNDYYPALQRENTELVLDPIATVAPHGLRLASGRELELDVLILATGFQAAEGPPPYAVQGLSESLEDVWARGAEAYLGTLVSGFPNLFLLVGPNTGLGHSSMILMIESQVQLVLSCLRLLERGRSLEVRPEAQARYNHAIQKRLQRTVWSAGCKSWYQRADGKNTTLWPGFTWEFRLKTRRARRRDLHLERG